MAYNGDNLKIISCLVAALSFGVPAADLAVDQLTDTANTTTHATHHIRAPSHEPIGLAGGEKRTEMATKVYQQQEKSKYNVLAMGRPRVEKSKKKDKAAYINLDRPQNDALEHYIELYELKRYGITNVPQFIRRLAADYIQAADLSKTYAESNQRALRLYPGLGTSEKNNTETYKKKVPQQ